MTKADEVMALVKAHVDGDDEHFRKLALCLAVNSDASSPKFARSVRALLERRPTMQKFTALLPHMESLLSVSRAVVDLKDMSLDAVTRAAIDRLLLEQTSREKLIEHALSPMRKLLFTGAPGVGKTMAASAIANALSLPMLRVQLHGVISQYMGETAAKLSKVFQTIREARAVYLFDEFDALAPDRGSGDRDVGEMRRIVNSLLLFIENDDSESIIVAATNHVDVLDRAMFRRFDQLIDFPLPTSEVAEHLVRSRLLWTADINWDAVRAASEGIGHADLASACNHANKDAVIGDRERITTTEIVAAIEARRIATASRQSLCP